MRPAVAGAEDHVITFLIGLANFYIGLATLMARGYIRGSNARNISS
jgi:hypothetical protein